VAHGVNSDVFWKGRVEAGKHSVWVGAYDVKSSGASRPRNAGPKPTAQHNEGDAGKLHKVVKHPDRRLAYQ
jgi:hypothetical protein